MTNHLVLTCDLYSFGFSILRPAGARARKRWVQWVSLLFLMAMAWKERGGFLMNSRTCILMSLTPKWDGRLKCLLTLLSLLLTSMSLK